MEIDCGRPVLRVTSHLVDGEANGVHVLPMAAVAPAVFLHKSHQQAACGLLVRGIVILLQKGHLILWVDPEGVCREGGNVVGMQEAVECETIQSKFAGVV